MIGYLEQPSDVFVVSSRYIAPLQERFKRYATLTAALADASSGITIISYNNIETFTPVTGVKVIFTKALEGEPLRYRTLITQVGTSAPTPSVITNFINTTGQTVTFSRTGVGEYKFLLSGNIMDLNNLFKAKIEFGSIGSFGSLEGFIWHDPSQNNAGSMTFYSCDPSGQNLADDMLNDTMFDVTIFL